MVALAAAAGVVIENARLYEESARREAWLSAAAEITAALLGPVQRSDALQLVADRARSVASADVASVLLADDESELDRSGRLRGVDRRGRRRPDFSGRAAWQARSPTSGDMFVIEDARSSQEQLFGLRLASRLARARACGDLAAAVGERESTAFSSSHGRRRTRTCSSKSTSSCPRRSPSRRTGAPGHAGEGGPGTAGRLRGSGPHRARSARPGDSAALRDRTLALENTTRLVGRPEAADRSSLRSTTSTPRSRTSGVRSSRSVWPPSRQISGLAGSRRPTLGDAPTRLGFQPVLRTSGPVDSGVPVADPAHLVAVVTEAVSNAARHAQAHVVAVTMYGRDEVVLEVSRRRAGFRPGTLAEGTAVSATCELSSRVAGGSCEATARPRWSGAA